MAPVKHIRCEIVKRRMNTDTIILRLDVHEHRLPYPGSQKERLTWAFRWCSRINRAAFFKLNRLSYLGG